MIKNKTKKSTFFRASLLAQQLKNLPAMQETSVDSWVVKILWRRDRLPIPEFLGFPSGSAGKESACNAGAEKAIATHSSTLVWEIPWMEEPGRLQSM